jgi:dihydrofolate reductase
VAGSVELLMERPKEQEEGHYAEVDRGMKVSMDEKVLDSGGTADWVNAWSEDYGLTAQINACVLGAGMYPEYEQYWTSIENEPDKPAWITGNAPTPAEIEWADFAWRTPHYVISSTVTSALWPNTTFLRGLDEIAAFKQQPGNDIDLSLGGARTTGSIIDARLFEKLRLILYPPLAGEGKALFAMTEHRRGLELRKVQQLSDGRVSLIRAIG